MQAWAMDPLPTQTVIFPIYVFIQPVLTESPSQKMP